MRTRAAAFFDLDRTVLAGSSGLGFTRALATEGLVRDGPVARLFDPVQRVAYRLYDVLGESAGSMALARGAVVAARAWPVEKVRKAGERAAELLEPEVQPYVRPLLAEHRAEGRITVLATATPYDMVAPLAKRLGFDTIIATRYSVQDGRYTGKIEGEFVWALGKLAAVRRLVAEQGIDLATSYAYSDSIYDVPLLRGVGHPYAVNADPRLAVFASLRGWPRLRLDVPPGVPKFLGLEPYHVLRPFVRPAMFPYARFEIDGVERIPSKGPAIVVANHRSYFDPFALAIVVARSGRPARFLVKEEVFAAPGVGCLARALGGIPVERAGRADLALRAARRVIEAGEVLIVLPQGTIPRGEEFFSPVLHGKTGAARLAATTRAPVIPIGLWGTEVIWPRSSRLPRMARLMTPADVFVHVGDPVGLHYGDPVRDTREIMLAVTGLLPAAARDQRVPSAAALAATYPPRRRSRSGSGSGSGSERRP